MEREHLRGLAGESGGGNSIISHLTLYVTTTKNQYMAASEETFKSFLARRKREYSLQFPFLKENQIVAKLRRLWAVGRNGRGKPRRGKYRIAAAILHTFSWIKFGV